MIQVDYAFVSSAADGLEATVLTAIDTITGMSLATIVTSKGYNAHAIAELRRFVYEMGRASGILQSDQEPAIRAVLRSVIVDIGGLSMRSSPIYSSQSQGTVERFHSTLYAQVRALRMHVAEKYKLATIPHTLFPLVTSSCKLAT